MAFPGGECFTPAAALTSSCLSPQISKQNNGIHCSPPLYLLLKESHADEEEK